MRSMRVGLIGCGEMGAAIGARLVEAGHEVSTVLADRGSETRARASEAGIVEVPDMRALTEVADVLFSVVPPELASRVAEDASLAVRHLERKPFFIDANAISPELLRQIAARFDPDAFIDGGIVGLPPGREKRPRLYASGRDLARLAPFDGIAFDILALGDELGRASAFKMAYAAVTKGTNALLTGAYLLAARHDLLELYVQEMSASQPELARRAEANISRLPADAGRWAFEMEEISRSFAQVGLPPGFHEAAAEVMRLLDASAFGHETRRTMDRSRTARQTIETIDRDRG